MFYLITRSPGERRALIEHLGMRGIYAVFHYVPLHSSPAGRRYGRVSGSMQVTDEVSETLLRLPLYYEMTEEEITTVAESVKSFYEGS
jgi:dTDP-4-amino-4,6-dideoxygalactose transaminase